MSTRLKTTQAADRRTSAYRAFAYAVLLGVAAICMTALTAFLTTARAAATTGDKIGIAVVIILTIAGAILLLWREGARTLNNLDKQGGVEPPRPWTREGSTGGFAQPWTPRPLPKPRSGRVNVNPPPTYAKPPAPPSPPINPNGMKPNPDFTKKKPYIDIAKSIARKHQQCHGIDVPCKPDCLCYFEALEGRDPLHIDEISVDRFAESMKAAMTLARNEGKGGWHDQEVSEDGLWQGLLSAMAKNNFINIANYAMMLHQRKQPFIKQPGAGR